MTDLRPRVCQIRVIAINLHLARIRAIGILHRRTDRQDLAVGGEGDRAAHERVGCRAEDRRAVDDPTIVHAAIALD